MHFRAILLCKRLHKPTSWQPKEYIHLIIIYIRRTSTTRRHNDNTLFTFSLFHKSKRKQNKAFSDTNTHQTKTTISFHHIQYHIAYNLQANKALVLTIWNRTKKYRLFLQIIACIFRQIVVLLQSKSNK